MPQPSPSPVAFLGRVGRRSLAFAGATGAAATFLARALRAAAVPPYRWGLIIEHLHFVGNRSVGIIMLTSAFTGLVLALQGYTALARFGAEQLVGSLVALSLVRELAPVLGALMITARAGSAIAATLGNMRVTEQVDALETMAIDPFSYLVAPRVLASLLAGPMLTAIFTLCGLGVAQVFSVGVLRLDRGAFNNSVLTSVESIDVVEGLSKSLVFSVVMIWIATYRGYHARGGAKGVGQATTRAVVETSVLVLAFDYVMTALLF